MKLKQCISIFLTLLFTLVTVAGVAPAAHARACNHTYGSTMHWVEYESYSTTHHKYFKIERKQCTKCGHVVEETVQWGYSTHSINIYDLGHDYTRGTHTYEYRCGDCGWQKLTQTIPCSGPPCPKPQSLRPIYELQ